MVLKHSIFLGFFSFLAILLGVVRDRLLAHYVGVGVTLDIYNAAFRVPDLLLGSMLSFVASATVIPFISKSVHAGEHEDTSARMSTLFFFFAFVMTVLAGIIAFILPYIAVYIVPGFSKEATRLYIQYTRLLLVQPLLLGISTLISALAQVRHQFFLYSVAPLLYTVGIIGGVFFYPQYGISGVFAGVILGAMTHLSVQSITLYTEKVRFSLKLFDRELLKEHIAISVPRSGSYIVTQLRLMSIASLATLFGVGALSIYLFAQRIHDACTQLIAQSVSTALLPSLSKHAAHKESAEYTKIFTQNAIVIVAASSCIALIIFFIPKVIVHFLYGETGYTEEIVMLTRLCMFAMPLSALSMYVAIALSSVKDTKTLLVANSLSTVATLFFVYYLYTRGMGIKSLGYGIIVSQIVYLIAVYVLYRRKRHTYFI